MRNSQMEKKARRGWIRPYAIAVLVAGVALAALLALPKRAPGYMDSYYHIAIARRIANGQGFTEPFVWNFLQQPDAIPHPSHLYWAPLPSILAAGAIWLFGDSYAAASLPFILCAALLPLMTFLLARKIGASEKEAAVSGVLAALAGFYSAYWTSPDSFAPFAVAGCASLYFMACAEKSRWHALAAGLFAGLGHLARPDGLLLVFTGLLWVAWQRAQRKVASRQAVRTGAWIAAGYLAVMAPWYVRTWVVAGSPLAGGGLRALWLRGYDELYAALHFPNLGGYLAWGWGNILASKGSALLSNLATLLGGLMFLLAPLAVWGWWANRRHPLLPPLAIFGGLLYLSMSLAFTFPGTRGSFFHSAGALLPFGFAAAFPGLRAAVAWFSARRKGWKPAQAYRVFGTAFVVLALAVGGLLYGRTIGSKAPVLAAWNQRDNVYAKVGLWLESHAAPSERVMVNNPPGFYYFAGRECVAIPSDGLDAMRSVRDKYGVRWLLLEYHHPAFLEAVYEDGASLPGWTARQTFYDPALGKAILYESDEAR
jgi:4-amino-4-deoxy-L-arabinose transferase-like glycosyltransferase